MMMTDDLTTVQESIQDLNLVEVEPFGNVQDQSSKKKLKFKLARLSVVVAVFLAGAIVIGYQVLVPNNEAQTVIEDKSMRVELLQSPNPTPLNSLDASTITTLPTDIQWQDDQLSYDVQSTYLIPDPNASVSADPQLLEQLVVFKVQATDTRTFGDARVVPARNYLNIRRKSQDFPPLGVDSQQLLPGAETTIYVPFNIPITEQNVTGLLGNLRNPYVVELDFQVGEQLEGSFDLFAGFVPIQSVESSTSSAQATPSATQPAESN